MGLANPFLYTAWATNVNSFVDVTSGATQVRKKLLFLSLNLWLIVFSSRLMDVVPLDLLLWRDGSHFAALELLITEFWLTWPFLLLLFLLSSNKRMGSLCISNKCP